MKTYTDTEIALLQKKYPNTLAALQRWYEKQKQARKKAQAG